MSSRLVSTFSQAHSKTPVFSLQVGFLLSRTLSLSLSLSLSLWLSIHVSIDLSLLWLAMFLKITRFLLPSQDYSIPIPLINSASVSLTLTLDFLLCHDPSSFPNLSQTLQIYYSVTIESCCSLLTIVSCLVFSHNHRASSILLQSLHILFSYTITLYLLPL